MYTKMDELEKTVQYAEENGMYVIVAPCRYYGTQVNIPTDQTKDSVLNLAQRFSSRKIMMYELLNEVGDVEGDGWYDTLINQAKEFRFKYPNPILVIPGWYWNRDFSIVQRRPFPDKNAVYDVHYYALWPKAPVSHNFEFMLRNIPVLFGEGGARQANREDVQTDIQFITRILQYVRENPLMAHYAAYDMSSGTNITSIFNPDGTLHSTHGKLFVDDMLAFPPTNFLK